MYKLPEYSESDPAEILKFIHQHPFITLCGCDSTGKPVATQVPVLIREENGQLVFRGHIMRNTDHHRAFELNSEVLVLFTGPNTYVSASWYTNPRQGSTWNFITVHARGTLKFVDEKALIETLRDTTSHFENNPSSPASFDQLPEEYINRLIKAIIAFEITVYKLDHVYKLSQDRDRESYKSIIQHLSGQGPQAQEIAAIMQGRENRVFE